MIFLNNFHQLLQLQTYNLHNFHNLNFPLFYQPCLRNIHMNLELCYIQVRIFLRNNHIPVYLRNSFPPLNLQNLHNFLLTNIIRYQHLLLQLPILMLMNYHLLINFFWILNQDLILNLSFLIILLLIILFLPFFCFFFPRIFFLDHLIPY
mmetsp:Transcript_18276/g.1604  ORF Transcript_18276/g.1604 Transcript_18276/m.1604 type:complete len:150 (+) Transcript_18276:83-532(+)